MLTKSVRIKRKVMSLSEKVEVLNKLDRRISIVVVRCHCGVNKLEIFFIKKNEDKFRRSIRASAPSSVKISAVSHCNPFSERMARALCVQLESEA
jgi:hypothetical protein